MDELATHAAGLICLTGGPDGPVGRTLQLGQGPKARLLMERSRRSIRTASMSSCNGIPARAASRPRRNG